jgi:hypothetical protein
MNETERLLNEADKKLHQAMIFNMIAMFFSGMAVGVTLYRLLS